MGHYFRMPRTVSCFAAGLSICNAMDKRPEPRLPVDLPVRIWGMDVDGRPFFQTATANNLSSEGIMISQISHLLKPGDVVGVQYGDKKARFNVVWVADAGLERKIEAGLCLRDDQEIPWPELATPRPVLESTGQKNKRRFARHKILFPLEISFDDSPRSHMNASATDIAGRGCYVQIMVPLPIGTKVRVKFSMGSQKIETLGVVRASDPGVGMGIEFTELDSKIQYRLQAHLEKLDEGFANQGSPDK